MSASISKAAQRDVARADWFANLLGLLFIALKLCHQIDWSWWWVTAPFWGPAAIVVAILVVLLFFAGLIGGLSRLLGK